MSVKSRLILVLALVELIVAQVEFRKPCPNIPPVQNFNISEFAGRWYELARYDHPLVAGGECVTMNFVVADRTVQVENTLRRRADNNTLKAAEKFNLVGEFRDKYVGTFNLTHPTMRTGLEHHVITTDYKNYALIWRCDQINSTFSTENAWLLARTRQLTGTLNQTIEGYIRAILSPDRLHRTLQDEMECTAGASMVGAGSGTALIVNLMVPILIAIIMSFRSSC